MKPPPRAPIVGDSDAIRFAPQLNTGGTCYGPNMPKRKWERSLIRTHDWVGDETSAST